MRATRIAPFLLLLAGCASTNVTLEPPSQSPVCAASESALVLWAPAWRADQKDVPAREEAANSGLTTFLASSGCFAKSQLRRVPAVSVSAVKEQMAGSAGNVTRVVGIEVRELGPVVRLFSSAALVEGGTEVLLRVTEYSPVQMSELRQFTVHWKNGGPGAVKGVASLPGDMQSALRAGLQPGVVAR